MAIFFENDPTLQSYWRSIILYGLNQATYKIALGKTLVSLSENNLNHIPWGYIVIRVLKAVSKKTKCRRANAAASKSL